MAKVRATRRRGTTRITSKHQVTLPTAALEQAGLREGERLVVRADGPGRITLERSEDVLSELLGSMTGIYTEGFLDKLRDEWD